MKAFSQFRPLVIPIVSRTIRNTFLAATFVLLVLSVVIPNSAQNTTAVAMIVCFLLAVPITKINNNLLRLGFLYLCSVVVTFTYLLVGTINGAPQIAVQHIITIYILSPFLWMFIATGLVQTLGIEKLIRWFVVLAFISCLSVALFFYLFINFGPNSVSFFKENSNLNLTDGNAAAIMFVYGSLIFLCGGFFSTPDLIGNLSNKVLLLGSLIIAALTSGRSALILSIPLGLFLGFLLSPNILMTCTKSLSLKKFAKNIVIFLLIFSAINLIANVSGIDFYRIMTLFFEELFSGGGSARSEQTEALIDGSLNTFGIGSGHGVGVAYIRSADFPWRYESVWVATIFRVGLIGSLIYLLPFLWYSITIVKLAKNRQLPASHKFMFSGFVCVFIAANTNPYIESFVFQWMYVFPLVSLFAVPLVNERRMGKNTPTKPLISTIEA